MDQDALFVRLPAITTPIYSILDALTFINGDKNSNYLLSLAADFVGKVNSEGAERKGFLIHLAVSS